MRSKNIIFKKYGIVLKNKKKNYLLFLNSPNNPSGQICENLKEISEVAKKYNLIILSDEIYSELSFNDKYESISNFCPEKTIISTGLSKWCGAGGWRLGYFIIPKNLEFIKNTLSVLASETFSAVSAPIQYAAIQAYEGDYKNYIKSSKEILKAIGEYVYDTLKSNKILINKPQGGFYLMPEFINAKFKSSSEMCDDILKKSGVALLPGSDFGFDKKKLIVRLSYTDFDGQKFMDEYEKNNDLSENTIKEFAPKIEKVCIRTVEKGSMTKDLALLVGPQQVFFNDTATTEIYTLSLHDALPISPLPFMTSETILTSSTES